MTARLPDRSRTVAIARTELRRTWRRVRGNDRAFGMAILAGLFLLVYSLGFGVVGLLVPEAAADGSAIGDGRSTVSGFVLFAAFLVLQRTVRRTGRLDAADGLLTIVSHVDALAGVLLAEFCRALAILVLPTVCFAVGFAVGARSPLPLVVTPLVAAMATALAVALGYAAGLAAKVLVARSRFVAAHKGVFGAIAWLALFAGYLAVFSASGEGESFLGPALGAVGGLPIGWLADVALATVPGSGAEPLRIVGAVVGVPAAVGGLGLLSAAMARRLWFTDPVEPATESRASTAGERPLLDRLLAGWVPRASLGVARKCWRRARRAPYTLQYALVPLIFPVFFAVQTVQSGGISPLLPAMVAVAGALATGAAFSLNPIGGEMEALPAVLTSGVDGRRFVGGLALAGLVPGLPVTLALTIGLGALAGLSPWSIARVAALGTVLAVAAPGVGAAAGVAFPKFERTTVGWSQEAVVPSNWAFYGFAIVLLLVALPALLASAVLFFLHDYLPAALVRASGLGITALLAAVIGYAGYRHAAGAVESYRME